MSGITLGGVTHSWKSFTASRINQLLHKSGQLWQEESFDTLICDPGQFRRIVDYVVRNPQKAHLSNWRWVGLVNTRFELRPSD